MKLLIDFVLVSGFVINLIIIFSLIKSSRKELSSRILILFFILILFVIIEYYGDLHEIKSIYLLGALSTRPAGYLVGPLLFLYVKSLYLKEENLVWNHKLHFIPFLVYFVFISFPDFISMIIGDYLFSYLKILEGYHFYQAEMIFQAVFLVIYALLTLKLLDKYHKSLKLNFSNLIDKDLNWVKHLVIGVLVLMSIDISTSIYELGFGYLNWDTGYLTVVPAIGFIFYLGYYGTNQSKILLPDFMLDDTPVVEQKTSPKLTQLSGNTSEEIEDLKKRLLEVLKNEQPFFDEDLTLKTLADLIPTTDKKLSALLNHYLNTTFYDLVNSYRVEAVKTKLFDEKYEKYTLLAIAYECGFKSKTSFNRIFKKVAGLSPSQYKKQFQD